MDIDMIIQLSVFEEDINLFTREIVTVLKNVYDRLYDDFKLFEDVVHDLVNDIRGNKTINENFVLEKLKEKKLNLITSQLDPLMLKLYVQTFEEVINNLERQSGLKFEVSLKQYNDTPIIIKPLTERKIKLTTISKKYDHVPREFNSINDLIKYFKQSSLTQNLKESSLTRNLKESNITVHINGYNIYAHKHLIGKFEFN